MQFSLFSRVWTSAFAKQSASFALATTHSQDVLFNASRPHRRSPLKGNPRRPRSGGHTDAIDFVAIASSLQATNGIRGVCNTNRLKAVPPSFVRRLRNNMAQSDGTTVKLGARYGRRLATPIPSSNRHIPRIRTLRIAGIFRNRNAVAISPERSEDITARSAISLLQSNNIICAARSYHKSSTS